MSWNLFTSWLFHWETWLIVAFVIGALELMLGTVLMGGMAIGAAGAAVVLALYGSDLAAGGTSWAVPIAIWAVLSLVSTWIVSKAFGETRPGEDINDAPYKGDND